MFEAVHTYPGYGMATLIYNNFRQVKIRNKWPDRKKIANKRFIADLC